MFVGCTSLSEVNIGSSVKSVGYFAFSGCSSLETISFGDSLTTIAQGAFSGCESLSSVSLGNSLKTIGPNAFSGCKFTTIRLPDSLTSIGSDTFTLCKSLKTIRIPDSVEVIEKGTFLYCSDLSSVEIGKSVTTIKEWVFSYCSSLPYIYIPKDVTFIDYTAFEDCASLEEIVVDDENPEYSSSDGILFSKNKADLLKYPDGKEIGDYEIPSTVKTIATSAFQGCNTITSLTIPESVTYIGSRNFYSSPDIREVNCMMKEPGICYSDFQQKVYDEAILNVPVGTKDIYLQTYPWEYFKNINEKDFSNVDTVMNEELKVNVTDGCIRIESDAPVRVFDMHGRIICSGNSTLIEGLNPGLYIILSQGRSIKVMVP